MREITEKIGIVGEMNVKGWCEWITYRMVQNCELWNGTPQKFLKSDDK